MYKVTRQLGPKHKEKLYNIAISPNIKRTLPTGLGFDTHQAKFFFEFPFPNINIDLTIIKDNSISCSPDQPAGIDNNFSEDRTSKITSGFYHHIKRGKVDIPVYWYGLPAFLTKGAFKEKMKTSFFMSCAA
jgi:hypothetical protein